MLELNVLLGKLLVSNVRVSLTVCLYFLQKTFNKKEQITEIKQQFHTGDTLKYMRIGDEV